MNSFFRNWSFAPTSLVRRLSLYIWLTGIMLAFISLGLEVIFDYWIALSSARESLLQIEQGYLKPICRSLWEADNDEALVLLKAMGSQGTFAVIRLPDHTILTNGLDASATQFITSNFLLCASFTGRETVLGSMTVGISLGSAFKGVFLDDILLIPAQFLIIFSMCFIFIGTFQMLIGNNLQRFSTFVRSIDSKAPVPPFALEGVQFALGKDELSQLVEAFQATHRNLQMTIDFLRQSEDRFRQFSDQTPSAVIILDSVGRTIFWNNAATRMFGYTQEEVMGHELSQILVSPDDRTAHAIGSSKFSGSDGESVASTLRERQFLCKDGSTRQVEISLTSAVIRGERQFLGIIRDLSEQRKAEEDARAFLHQKEMNDMKSKLVSMISHEFRTPVAAIKNAVFLLKQPGIAANPESQARVSRIMESSLHQMGILLDQVTNLSREELDQIVFKPVRVEIGTLCRKVCIEAETLWSGRKVGLALHPELAESYSLDPQLLMQIFDNLLSNALKYSSGDVDFEVRPASGQLEFLIRDRGIGIPDDDQPRIFQTFQRAHNVGAIRGTGLGLTIVRKFARRHEGEVTFTSKEGEGSTFILRIPGHSTGKKPGSP
ncbi:MAG: PAS domain-containing sensor histidine kinase [Candidatus Ozemobacteraceae bacterium]